MSDEENWEKYGFPDAIFFRTIYKPMTGLVKALNERLEAVELTAVDVPEFFNGGPGMVIGYLQRIDSKLFDASMRFVDPDNISSAQNFQGCFWKWEDLLREAAGGMQSEIIYTYSYNPLTPAFPAKWAKQRYNAINLLRYVATSDPGDWPDFNYEDRYNSFKFKA